jgi:hypothetical protein
LRNTILLILEVSNDNVLSLMLYYFMIQNSNDDLKEKAKKALKK